MGQKQKGGVQCAGCGVCGQEKKERRETTGSCVQLLQEKLKPPGEPLPRWRRLAHAMCFGSPPGGAQETRGPPHVDFLKARLHQRDASAVLCSPSTWSTSCLPHRAQRGGDGKPFLVLSNYPSTASTMGFLSGFQSRLSP